MANKKILHIYSSWTKGGAEKLMLTLAKELNKYGIENIIGSPSDSYLFSQAKKLGLKAYPLVIKGSFAPFGLINLLKIANKENIDIIHSHQGKTFWPSIFVKYLKRPSPKVIFHRHAQLGHRFYSRNHYKLADKVIAISKAVKEGLVNNEKVDPSKISVIYNGTDFNRFNANVSGEKVRKIYGLSGKTVIGTVGAMNSPLGKGQGYLIEAAAQLRLKNPNLHFLIVGDGPILNELKSLAQKLKVGDIVTFSGYHENVEDFIAAMDIFCFLAWDKEGFGQVMVEAQAMAKPVIGTDIGGIPETFLDGASGYLIKPRDVNSLCNAVNKLLENKEKAVQMGKNGHEFVKNNFSIAKMALQVKEIYDVILISEPSGKDSV